MSANMSTQLFGIGLVLVLVQVSKRLDLENPDNLQILRMAYGSAQVIVASLLFYIYNQIQSKNDTTELKYEDKKPMSQDAAAEIVTTVKDYDMGELRKQLQTSGIGIAILMFIHFKFGYVQPLFLQSILPIKSLLETNLAKVHIFGSEASGKLQRPWKAASMFDALSPPEDTTAATLPPTGITELPSDDETEVSQSSKKENKKGSKKASASSK